MVVTIPKTKKSGLDYPDLMCLYRPSWYKDKYKKSMESWFKYRVKQVVNEEKLRIELNEQIIAELPFELDELYAEIEKSKYMLEYEDDWDDEGSIGYETSTWKRAIQFIADYAKWALNTMSMVIPKPKIYPGPNGSIDILWKSSYYRLLINISKDTDKDASFYGDYKWEKIKGTFNPSKVKPGILLNLFRTIND